MDYAVPCKVTQLALVLELRAANCRSQGEPCVPDSLPIELTAGDMDPSHPCTAYLATVHKQRHLSLYRRHLPT